MARPIIPNPDVPFLDANGRVSKAWFDFLNALAKLRVQDLSDIAAGSAPANANTIRYSGTNKNWTFGA